MRTLDYLNEGYEWVIDLDIEAYFDTVNHDKLISILREHVNDSTTLHLIRKFLQAGIMENGLVKASTIGMPVSYTHLNLRSLWKLCWIFICCHYNIDWYCIFNIKK